jgi:poly(A) polymerase
MPALHGPALGERLKSLQRRWLASGLRLDKAALLQGSDD